ETGRCLSNIGSASSQLAYPLLALALTHSPAKAGVITFARTIPQPLLGMLAGVAADRGDRKRQMIFADVVSAGALRSVVPIRQLPAAVGAQQARGSATLIAGPQIGGALFQIGRAVPFLV